MTIHKEGRTILIILTIILSILNVVVFYLTPDSQLIRNAVLAASIIFFLLILQFFRNPRIRISQNDKSILAPADGKVVAIEETEETEHLNERCRQISIFMSPVNVHVNRMPAGGKISYFRYHPGKYLVAWHPKSSTENERTTVAVRMKDGSEILFRQIAGALARRIKCYVKEGQSLNQGDEFGFIKFGSRVDIFLPLNATVTVKVGDITKGGRTILAELA